MAEQMGTPTILVFAAGELPRNRLIDRETRAIYPWPVNHDTEDSIKVLGRQLSRSGKSKTIRLMRHPTHPGAIVLTLHGSILDREPPTQYDKFVQFFGECDDRTFDLLMTNGDSYEIAIVSFDAPRQPAADRQDGTYLHYSLGVEVLSINQSPLSVFYS